MEEEYKIYEEWLYNLEYDLSSVKEDVCSPRDKLDSILEFLAPKK